ncbi:hypothetical protein [Mycobacterium sp. HUMS_1102779]|uniref:hypothetical protein n=1 Tax=Mycobacterium sp. HUMS_1102779 TaxID=3383487 RepID=UPI00389ACC78
MNDKPDLSWLTEEAMHEVDAYLDAQLAAIDALRSKASYVDHEIYCTGCHSKIIEVIPLKLPDGTDVRVIRLASLDRLPRGLPDPGDLPPGEHGRLAAAASAERKASKRRGKWGRSEPFIEGMFDPTEPVWAACDCRTDEYLFTVGGIFGREGRKSTVSPPPGHAEQ